MKMLSIDFVTRGSDATTHNVSMELHNCRFRFNFLFPVLLALGPKYARRSFIHSAVASVELLALALRSRCRTRPLACRTQDQTMDPMAANDK